MDIENDEDERMHTQASFSAIIREYKAVLNSWLQKEPTASSAEDLEDRELDALLLKVLPQTPRLTLTPSSNPSRNSQTSSTHP
jgi:hypothetical protein